MSNNPDHSSPPGPPGSPELRPHVFDGIQEYDQRLPNWWLFTFYFTIAWFAIYWFLYYQLGWFKTDHEAVTSEVAHVQELQTKEQEAMLSKIDDNVLWDWSRNPSIAADGKVTYDKFCFACHAPDLSASLNGVKLPGLPLNDKEWKYGNNPMSLFRMVSKGSPDKTAAVQMPPWEQQLSPLEIAKVVAFVLSHHDQKDPGKVVGPGPAPAPAPGGATPVPNPDPNPNPSPTPGAPTPTPAATPAPPTPPAPAPATPPVATPAPAPEPATTPEAAPASAPK